MKKTLMTLGTIAAIAAPLTAVVACSTGGKISDTDGFKKAPLIKDFNIMDESIQTKKVDQFSIDGKVYDVTNKNEANSFVSDWAKSVNSDNGIISAFEGFKTMPGISVSYDKVIVNVKITGEKINIKFTDTKQKPVVGLGHQGEWETDFKSFGEKVSKEILNFPQYAGAWVKKHNFTSGMAEINIPAKKSDSIDSIIYTQAQALPKNKVIKTDEDEVIFGNYGGWKKQDNLNIRPYVEGNSGFYDLSTEFRAGDSIIFAFNDEDDMASFTQRVKYDNTSDANNEMNLNDVKVDNIFYQPINVVGGELKAVATIDNLLGDIKPLFNLEVIDRNAVQLTFNDIFDKTKHHIEQQLLYLFGFCDENNDGKINRKDINMVGPFAIDSGKLYANYLDKTVGRSYIHKDTTIAGYGEVEAAYKSL